MRARAARHAYGDLLIYFAAFAFFIFMLLPLTLISLMLC